MFWFSIKSLINGKSMVRTLMNYELSKVSVSGSILDVGSGENASYEEFINYDKDSKIKKLDQFKGDNSVRIDLEKDKFPVEDNSQDNIFALNILEHIFNYSHLLSEIYRVQKAGGQLFGFVPFLVNYHPDPSDYFRYTTETLANILKSAGFKDIRIVAVGTGPFSAAFNILTTFTPGIINAIGYPIVYMLDAIILLIKPGFEKRYPLGYYFTAIK